MCFSERVSWMALVASWTGCAALIMTGKPEWVAVAILLGVAGSMQLWEALLWREPRCSSTNGLVTNIAAVVNHTEPLVYYAASSTVLQARDPRLAAVALVVVSAYVVVFGALTSRFLKRPLERRCTLPKDPHGLVWQWADNGSGLGRYAYLLFVAALVTTTYAYMPSGVNHLVTVVAVGSFILSYAQYQGRNLTGTMWCFFGAVVPWFFVAIN